MKSNVKRDYSVYSSYIAPTIEEIDKHLEDDNYDSKNRLVSKRIVEQDGRLFLYLRLNLPMLMQTDFDTISEAFKDVKSDKYEIVIGHMGLWRSLDDVIQEQRLTKSMHV